MAIDVSNNFEDCFANGILFDFQDPFEIPSEFSPIPKKEKMKYNFLQTFYTEKISLSSR